MSGRGWRPDMAATFYGAARAEILERMRLRDQAVVLFFGAAAVICALIIVLLVTTAEWWIALKYGAYLLVLIPVLANSAATAYSQHIVLIGAAENYLITELEPKLVNMGVYLPNLDSSDEVIRYKQPSNHGQHMSHGAAMMLISMLALISFVVIQTLFGPVGPAAKDLVIDPVLRGREFHISSLTIAELALVGFVALIGAWFIRSAGIALRIANRQSEHCLAQMMEKIAERDVFFGGSLNAHIHTQPPNVDQTDAAPVAGRPAGAMNGPAVRPETATS